MNFLGLGFSFGAKNNGLLQMQKHVAKGFGQMAGAQAAATAQTDRGSSSLERFNTFLNVLSVSQLRKIADSLENLADGGRQLTTAYEGTLLQNKKTASSMAYQWGKTGESVRGEAQSIANATGMSFEHSAQAVIEFGNATDEFKKIGIKSATQLGKAMEVSGLDASALRSSLQTLTGVVGIESPEAMQELMSAFVEAGQQTGSVTRAFSSFESVLGNLQSVAAAAGKKLPEAELVKLGKQTAMVTAGMFKMGWGMEDATKFSEMLSEKLIQSKIDFQDMFAGTKTDIPAMAQALAVGTGDIEKAFELMRQGPAGFMQGMNQMLTDAKKNGGDTTALMKFMGAQMREVFGGDEKMITLFMQRAGAETTAAMQKVSDSTKKIGDAAKQFVDPRTLDEKLKLVEDTVIARFRGINRVGGRFVKRAAKQFEAFADKLEVLGKDKGPIGDIVRKLSELHQLGAQSLIPETLRPMATVLGSIVKEMGPALAAVAGLLYTFGAPVLPVLAVVAALGAMVMWFIEAKMEGKTTGEALKQVGEKLKKSWEWLKTFGKLVWDAVVSVAKDIWKELTAIDWKGLWNTFVKDAGPVLQSFFKNVMSWFFQALDWLINTGLPWAIEAAWEALKGIVALAMDAIMGIMDGIGDYLKKSYPQWADGIQFVFDIIHDTLDGIKGAFAWLFDFLPKLGAALANLILNPIETIQKAFNAVVGSVAKVWNMVFGGDPTSSVQVAANASAATAQAIPKTSASAAISNTPSVSANTSSAKVTPKSAPAPTAAKRALADKGAADQSLLTATNSPQWYNDWKNSFEKMMAQQTNALVNAMKPGPGKGGRAGSRDENGTGQMMGTASNGMPR